MTELQATQLIYGGTVFVQTAAIIAFVGALKARDPRRFHHAFGLIAGAACVGVLGCLAWQVQTGSSIANDLRLALLFASVSFLVMGMYLKGLGVQQAVARDAAASRRRP